MGKTKLIVGLGNPGKEYVNTRHNTGFIVIDYYAEKKGLSFKEEKGGLYSIFNNSGNKYILLKPLSYMNSSGDVVKKYVDYYKIDIDDILIIYDDKDFDVGTFKVKTDGSSAGHNGINDIINKLKTDKIKRIRVGIGKNNFDLVDYVLGKFSLEDLNKINNILPIISCVIDDFSVNNINDIMNKYNRKE